MKVAVHGSPINVSRLASVLVPLHSFLLACKQNTKKCHLRCMYHPGAICGRMGGIGLIMHCTISVSSIGLQNWNASTRTNITFSLLFTGHQHPLLLWRLLQDLPSDQNQNGENYMNTRLEDNKDTKNVNTRMEDNKVTKICEY